MGSMSRVKLKPTLSGQLDDLLHDAKSQEEPPDNSTTEARSSDAVQHISRPVPLPLAAPPEAPPVCRSVAWADLAAGDQVTLLLDCEVVKAIPTGGGYAGPAVVVLKTAHALRQFFPDKEVLAFKLRS